MCLSSPVSSPKWKFHLEKHVFLYLLCDWPRPGRPRLGSGRPPSPGHSGFPVSGSAETSACESSTCRLQTAPAPPHRVPWNQPPPGTSRTRQRGNDSDQVTLTTLKCVFHIECDRHPVPSSCGIQARYPCAVRLQFCAI